MSAIPFTPPALENELQKWGIPFIPPLVAQEQRQVVEATHPQVVLVPPVTVFRPPSPTVAFTSEAAATMQVASHPATTSPSLAPYVAHLVVPPSQNSISVPPSTGIAVATWGATGPVSQFLPTDELLVWSYADYIVANKGKAREWLVEGLLPRAGIVMLAGEPMVGKSLIVALLTSALSSGNAFLGRKTMKTGTLLVKLEHDSAGFSDNLEKIAKGAGLDELDLAVVEPAPGHMFDLFDAEMVSWIATHADERECGLVVVDCLRAATSMDENVSAEPAALRPVLAKLSGNGRRLVLLVHHLDKAGTGPRGSGDFSAMVDTLLILRRAGDTLRLTARHHTTSTVELGLKVTFGAERITVEEAASAKQVAGGSHQTAAIRAAIISVLTNQPLSARKLREQVTEKVKCAATMVDEVRNAMETDKLITRKNVGKAHEWKLSPEGSETQKTGEEHAVGASSSPLVASSSMPGST